MDTPEADGRPDIEEAYEISRDGARLYRCVHPLPQPRGVVLLTHGLGEHSGRYGHVLHHFQEQQIAGVRFDLRGHGRSDGIRGHTGCYDLLLDDLSLMFQMTRARFPGVPIVIYGHSLGGNVVANWCLRRKEEAAQAVGAVLSAPWFKLAERPSPLKVGLIRALSRFWPSLSIPTHLRSRNLTRNRQAAALFDHDPLVHRRITVQMAIGAYDAAHWALEHASSLELAILGLHGTADRVTSPEGTLQFCRTAPRAELLLLEGLVHEPHNEPEWRQVLGNVRSWIVDLCRGSFSPALPVATALPIVTAAQT